MDKDNKKDNTPKKVDQTKKDNQKEEQNKTDNSNNKSNSKKEKPKEKNIFQKYPLTFLLIGALLISVLWGFLKANRVEKQLTKKYETHIDLLHQETGLQLARTLSWSLRSELNRENQESAERYMINFLQGNLNIQSVKYIDSKSNKVTFATNKKDEGKEVKDEFILGANEAKMEIRDNAKLFVCPVFGFDSQLGIVVFEWVPPALSESDEGNGED